MTTVVLGWDALDYKLLEEFGMTDAFGEHVAPLETFANDIIGEPHTREVWPSIITGESPTEHGIYAVEAGEGVKWSNPWIRLAAKAGNYCIPHGIRTEIGRRLRSEGAGVEKYHKDYYADRGLSTVFDGRRSLPIAVPNYWTDRDERLGYMFDRGAQMGEWLDRDDEGWQPASSDQQARVEEAMHSEAGQKLGQIEAALQREYDLIFAWFGFVDTFGHVEPVAANPVQRRGYEQAAEWTDRIKSQLDDDDTLVCVSDHGLRDGHHTMDATIASDDASVVEAADSVFDVRAAIDSVTPRRESVATPTVRETHSRAGQRAGADDIHGRLEDLGYV
ncbi:alkaline phosphatase family protein [Haloarcula argentinensis]|uniref:Nucleotide pyrophosphatase n=1 Tax=Haloarcula argentinensis TaxID=43776 RepID=A0A847UKB3_HALAR|nr:alkaline phosphatase family protein [Haloarcula argentinensis]NLV14365.1 nucleotide pyrophosphatase [Haloarcula argentinensis]